MFPGQYLSVLDLSDNPRLNSIPPSRRFDGAKYQSLTSLNLANTNISQIRNDTFQRMQRGLLSELDVSGPALGTAPLNSVSVNLTGFSELSIVTWYNNHCPAGFFARSCTPSRPDYSLCVRCPVGTYSPHRGGIYKKSCRYHNFGLLSLSFK